RLCRERLIRGKVGAHLHDLLYGLPRELFNLTQMGSCKRVGEVEQSHADASCGSERASSRSTTLIADCTMLPTDLGCLRMPQCATSFRRSFVVSHALTRVSASGKSVSLASNGDGSCIPPSRLSRAA